MRSQAGRGMAVENKGENEGSGAKPDKSATPDVTKLSAKDGSTAVATSGDGGDRGPGGGRKRKGDGPDGGKAGSGQKKQGIGDLIQFLKEVVIEFRKIAWPTRQQVFKETWAVLFLVAAITLMVLGFDWFLSHAIFQPLENFARMHGGGIGHAGL